MMNFDEKELFKLAQLSRIEYSPEEKEMLLARLKEFLSYIDLLKEVNTEGVEPCRSILKEVVNAMREDEEGEHLPREVYLANAPAHTGGMIRVPPVQTK